jgi:hypothetical protein
MLDPGSITSAATAAAASVDFDAVLAKATRAALGGGASGAAASVVQVLSLMWVRTTINYQYRNGGTAADALAKLYAEGGVGRLYQGLPYALVQAPLTRFGDVAANAGIPVLLDSLSGATPLPPFLRQIAPSLVSAAWRTIFMPIDTLKTSLQVDGDDALAAIKERLETRGPGTLWEGSLAAAATSFAGSYPWWYALAPAAASRARRRARTPRLSRARARLAHLAPQADLPLPRLAHPAGRADGRRRRAARPRPPRDHRLWRRRGLRHYEQLATRRQDDQADLARADQLPGGGAAGGGAGWRAGPLPPRARLEGLRQRPAGRALLRRVALFRAAAARQADEVMDGSATSVRYPGARRIGRAFRAFRVCTETTPTTGGQQ